MGNLRGWEWVILLVLVLLLFGARKLPDLARSVGRSLKIFRSEVKDLKGDEAASDVPDTNPYTSEGSSDRPVPGVSDDGEPQRP